MCSKSPEPSARNPLYRYVGANLLMGMVVILLYSRSFFDLVYVTLPFRCFPRNSQMSLMHVTCFCSFVLVVLGVGGVGFVWFRLHWRALMPLSFRYAWILKAVFLLASVTLVSAILLSRAVAGPALGFLVRLFFYGHVLFAWLGNTYAEVYDSLLPP
jgi:hypothetical protein